MQKSKTKLISDIKENTVIKETNSRIYCLCSFWKKKIHLFSLAICMITEISINMKLDLCLLVEEPCLHNLL